VNTVDKTEFFSYYSKFFFSLIRLSYHFNTEAALFACLSLGWATTTGRLLGPKVRNSIKCLSQGQRRATASKVEPKFRNLSILQRMLVIASTIQQRRSSFINAKTVTLPYLIYRVDKKLNSMPNCRQYISRLRLLHFFLFIYMLNNLRF